MHAVGDFILELLTLTESSILDKVTVQFLYYTMVVSGGLTCMTEIYISLLFFYDHVA